MVSMATEMVPVVDLRVLSQSDLDALAVASAHAVAPGSSPDAEPLPPLKIDRAVFNESAGSRKQTFTRLRLGNAAGSSSSAPTAIDTSPPATAPSAGNDPGNNLIAYHLRSLFARDDPSRPSSPPPPPETLALALLGTSHSPPRSPSPDPDRQTTNSKGISVDLVRLAELDGLYDEELGKRTAGLMSEAELMGFIKGLGGKWVSQRKKRKFVDASFFGDHLPSGWKLQLGLKRKARQAWVHCLSYVSPTGRKFASCKEVSAYLMSLLGYPEVRKVPIQHNSTGQRDLCDGDGDNDAAGFQHQVDSVVDNQNVLPVTSVAFSSHSSNSHGKVQGDINPANTYKCQECNLTLHDQSAYAQHHMLFHEKGAKRRRKSSKFGQPVAGKDGKFECPLCHKTFEEQSWYFGHVGAHAKHHGLTPEAFLDKISSGEIADDSLTGMQFTFQELTESREQNAKTSGQSGSQHLNYPKDKGGDSSKAKEFFSTKYMDNFNRPVEACSRSEEISPVTDTRSACKYRNNSADYTGVTVPKIANQLDGRIGGLPEVADFNDQAGSYNDFRPTILANANHYKDQITDRGLAASKHGGVNNTVKARDVNLNSCLATISFPIASANNETSISLDDTNQSSIAGKCFSGSFNNNDGASTTSSCSGSNNKVSGFVGVSNGSSNASRCVSASHGDDAVANTFSNKNNTMVYHSSLSTHPTSPVATGVDCFPSRSAHPKDSDKEGAYGTRMDAMQNRTSNAAGFSAEAYNSGIYTADVTGRNCAQFNSSFSHLKPNTPSRCSQPESNTLTANNFTKGIDVNCMNGSFVHRSDANNMKGSFVNRPISNNEPNGYVHSMMGKPSNAMQNHYNGAAPSCAPLSAANTSQNVNGLMSMQANFGSMSTLVHSVGDVPRSSTTKDQCDLQLGFGGQKQQISARYGDLSPAASGSTQLGGMGRNNNLPAGSSQFGSMARPNSLPAGFSQFGSMARPNSLPAGSSQFGSMARPNSLTGGFSQFGSLASSNYLQTGSSQFGRMAGPNSIGPADSSQFGRMAGPNSRPPAESSQFGSMARPNSRPPAESSQFGSMANQNFVRTSEPTLQMGSGPRAQSGWDLNLSRMVNGGGMTLEVCMWCNGQYHHFGPVEQTQALICPSCRDKMALQGLVPNDGSWQP